MKLNTLCTFALAFLAAPLSVTAEKEPLIKETLEVIKALNNAVAAYQGGIAGIPTVFSAMRNTMGIRKKLNDYVASVTMYDEKDCAVIRNTTSMTADAMVDLLNMGRVKLPLVAAAGRKATARALIQPMFKDDTNYAREVMSKLSEEDAKYIRGDVDRVVLAYEALFRATA